MFFVFAISATLSLDIGKMTRYKCLNPKNVQAQNEKVQSTLVYPNAQAPLFMPMNISGPYWKAMMETIGNRDQIKITCSDGSK